ncbi:MAG: spore germination protein GerW family protein [Acidimicrobiales bacterium]
MTTHTNDTIDITENSILDDLRGTRDLLSVGRVFGDPITAEGVTIIPVARISGGAGGGGGEDTDPDKGGRGFGSGFGLGAHAIGVYELRDGTLSWKPAVDVNRVIRGGQVLGGIIAVCVSLVLLRCHR